MRSFILAIQTWVLPVPSIRLWPEARRPRACISLLLPSPFWKCFHFCGIIQALSKLSSGWHCCIRRCCIRSRRFSSQIKMYFSISRTAGVSISRGRGPQFLPGRRAASAFVLPAALGVGDDLYLLNYLCLFDGQSTERTCRGC